MSILKGIRKKEIREVTKHPALSAGDASDYQNGAGKTITTSYAQYLNSIERLNSCVRTTAAIASGARFEFWKKDSDFKETKVKVKQFDDLFMNDYQSNSDFLRELIASLLTYDSAYIVAQNGTNKSRKGFIDFYLLDPNKCTVVTGEPNDTIKEIEYTSSSGNVTRYPYSQIIYINSSITSTNIIYAIPRIQSLINSINNILRVDEYTSAYLASGGKSSAIIGFDGMLSEEQQREVKREVNGFLRDVNPRALMINAEKFNMGSVSGGMTSAGVIDMVKHLNDSVMRAFNMPEFLLGNYFQSVSETVLRDAARIFFEISIKPLFRTIEQHFARYMRNELGVKDIFVKMNYEGINILEASLKDKLDMSERLYKLGTMSANEVRIELDKEPLEFDAANYHTLPAYLQSNHPITLENYDEDIARFDVTESSETPNGDGGANNTEDEGGRG